MSPRSRKKKTMKQSAACPFSEGQKWGKMGQQHATSYNMETLKNRIKPHYPTLSHVNLIFRRSIEKWDNNGINKHYFDIPI